MATAIKLRSDIRKLKKAINTKGISSSVKDKLKSQLEKAENELAGMKKGKKPAKTSTGGTKSVLSKLQSIIKKKKYGAYRAQGVDLKKDADRPALPIGKRKSKSGNTYYEYRANRIDVKQPPKRYPKLEDGGYMAGGGIFEVGDMVKVDDSGYVKLFSGFDISQPAKIISKEKGKAFGKVKYFYGLETADGKKPFNKAQESMLTKSAEKGGYMAGGGNVSKKYEKIDGTDYELKIQVYYDKGGMNYFTSRPEARGYYLSVSPVQVERRENGIMVESYAAFSGIKALVLPVQRQSPKAEKQAEELAVKMMPELKEQVTSNLKRKLGLMAEGGVMETREILSEEQQMAKGGQLDDLLSKQSEFLAQLTDIKLESDLETEEGVLNYRNQIAPIKEKLSLIENELEELGYEAYEKGGYMAKGGMTLGDISKKYDKNEDINYHTENVVLLATHFGTESELRDAKTIKAKHDAIGHLPFNLYEERNELGDKLYKRMQEQIRENGMGAKPKKMAYGGYMAKGGEMHRYEKGGYMAEGGMMAKGGEEPLYDSAGFTREDDSRIIIKSGNNGKLKQVFNEYKNQKNELKANEIFDNERMNGKSVFLFVNDDLYDQYIQESDVDEYAKGGYMAEGGKYLRKLPTEDDVYMIMQLQKKSGFGSLLNSQGYFESELKDVIKKYDKKISADSELKSFTINELLNRKSLTHSHWVVNEAFENKVKNTKRELESLGLNDFKELV